MLRCRGGVTQLIRLQDQLIALHDVTTRRGPPGGRRSAVTALDLASLTPLATPAADILEGYQLSGMAVAEQHGPVVVAGSVRLSGEPSRQECGRPRVAPAPGRPL